MPDGLDAHLRTACDVAREAGDLARRWLAERRDLGVRLKGRQDWLTEADGAVERLIRRRLGEAFPADSFLGEEGGASAGAQAAGAGLWVVDPIDGTANFARGIACFVVSIAYCRAGRTEIGAIYDPMADELFAARRGGGATRNGEPIRVSGADRPEAALIDAGYSHRHAFTDYLSLVDRLVASGYGFRQAGSAALGLAQVAGGRIDGYCELHLYCWDVLAGLLLVEEAGGWTSDFLAGDGMAKGDAILACTPALAPALRTLTGIGGA